MSRWLGPAICFAVATLSCGSVALGDVAWVLVGLDHLVGIDPRAQALATGALFTLMGLGWAGAALRRQPAADAPLDE